MKRWFVVAVMFAVVGWVTYAYFSSDLCAWVNTTPSPDGCAEVFNPIIQPAIALSLGVFALTAGALATRSRMRAVLSAFVAFGVVAIVGYYAVMILTGPHTRVPIAL